MAVDTPFAGPAIASTSAIEGPSLTAWESRTGGPRWTYRAPRRLAAEAVPSLLRGGIGAIFVSGSEGTVRRIDAATGRLDWGVDLRPPSCKRAGWRPRRSSSGTTSRATPSASSSPAISSSPWASSTLNGHLGILDEGGFAEALPPTRLPTAWFVGAPRISSGGAWIYAGAGDGRVYQMDRLTPFAAADSMLASREPLSEIVLDEDVDSHRLLALSSTRLTRFCVPFPLGIH
jgi:outer membrane protein assembly factor BamB